MQIFDQNLHKSAHLAKNVHILAKNARILAKNARFYANFGRKMRAVNLPARTPSFQSGPYRFS